MNNNSLKHNAKLVRLAKDIKENWLADDGGLTMAALDELSSIARCRELIKKGNTKKAQKWLGNDFATYGEPEDILQDWIWNEPAA